jgi:hypothetical protein
MVPVLSEKSNRPKIQCVTAVCSVCVIGGVVVVEVEKKQDQRWPKGGTSSSLMSAKNEECQPTKLDESKESLSLFSILQALVNPITEEDAWSILYQSAKTAFQCFNSANPPPPPPTTSRHNNNNQQQSHKQQHANNNIHNLTDKSENEVMKCVVVMETFHLWIHSDGHVLPLSFQLAADSIVGEYQLSSALLLLPHTVHIII